MQLTSRQRESIGIVGQAQGANRDAHIRSSGGRRTAGSRGNTGGGRGAASAGAGAGCGGKDSINVNSGVDKAGQSRKTLNYLIGLREQTEVRKKETVIPRVSKADTEQK